MITSQRRAKIIVASAEDQTGHTVPLTNQDINSVEQKTSLRLHRHACVKIGTRTKHGNGVAMRFYAHACAWKDRIVMSEYFGSFVIQFKRNRLLRVNIFMAKDQNWRFELMSGGGGFGDHRVTLLLDVCGQRVGVLWLSRDCFL